MGKIIDNEELVKKIAQNRPPEERNITARPDRIGKYLIKFMDDFLFVELSDEYLKKCNVDDFMKGVPIPLRTNSDDSSNVEEVPLSLIAKNMAFVMGVDPKFKHNDSYKRFVFRVLGSQAIETFCNDGGKAAEKGDLERACIMFRAALVWSSDDPYAMFGYARVCSDMYSGSTDEDYIGNFKAEALDYFELITEIHPDMAIAWYYLGYFYLNMGLYSKAGLTWEKFVNNAEEDERTKEIKERLEQIKEPIKMEMAYTLVLASKWEEGLTELKQFTDGPYKDWWPMWYYIGVACSNLGKTEEAIDAFTKVLRLEGSQIETMNELIEIYKVLGNDEMVTKYTKKIELITE